jgi:hypothetical protein
MQMRAAAYDVKVENIWLPQRSPAKDTLNAMIPSCRHLAAALRGEVPKQ